MQLLTNFLCNRPIAAGVQVIDNVGICSSFNQLISERDFTHTLHFRIQSCKQEKVDIFASKML